jgi:hypothetical protein
MGCIYKKDYPLEEGSWRLNFYISHYDENCSVYLTKGKLMIDNFEYIYNRVNTSEMGSVDDMLFTYLSTNEPED